MVIDDILKYARMNKELAGVDEDSLEAQSSELKKLVQAQAAELELLKQRVSGRIERKREKERRVGLKGGRGGGGGCREWAVHSKRTVFLGAVEVVFAARERASELAASAAERERGVGVGGTPVDPLLLVRKRCGAGRRPA